MENYLVGNLKNQVKEKKNSSGMIRRTLLFNSAAHRNLAFAKIMHLQTDIVEWHGTWTFVLKTAMFPSKLNFLLTECLLNFANRWENCAPITSCDSDTFKELGQQQILKKWEKRCVQDSQLCYAISSFLLQGKEGAFMVRDSRQAGVYTVSVYTKAPG